MPTLLVPIIYFSFGLLSSQTSGMAQAVLVLLGLVGAVVSLIVALVMGIRTLRDAAGRRRRARGRFTAKEQAAIDQVSAAEAAWSRARALRAALLRREVPPPVQVWDVVLRAGEHAFIDTQAEYARYYGQDVAYSTSQGFFFGRPSFVLAGLAANAIGNAAARSSAEAAAAQQWRDYQHTRVVVTNERIMCLVFGQWLSFEFGAMTAIYPEIGSWTLVTQFDGAPGPLRLSGMDVPGIAVLTVQRLFGTDVLAEHPSLRALD